MKIWLLKAGEPLPIEGSNVRLYRTGMLAEALAGRGHHVTWWTSTVDHVTKRHRFARTTRCTVNERIDIILLKSFLYKRNVSFSRLLNHTREARLFLDHAMKCERPDIIVSSLPTLEFCRAAVRYGQAQKIPVVLDIRDLWPDIFGELGPSVLRPLISIFLKYWVRIAKEACGGATAITGITPEFVNWGVKHANRVKNEFDQCFPHGYSKNTFSRQEIEASEIRWKGLGIVPDKERFIACFFGNFGRQFELETVITAAHRIRADAHNILFVLCGSGDSWEQYKRQAEGSDNIIFPGRVNACDIQTLMKMSFVGLAPYRSNRGFVTNLPNKPIEYMSVGLPVVSSLQGTLKELLEMNNCGVTYDNGDAEGLKRVLIDLRDNQQLLKSLSSNAYKLYSDNYTTEKVYGNLCAYLEHLALQSSASR